MPNRSMQAKAEKLKRQSQAKPRAYTTPEQFVARWDRADLHGRRNSDAPYPTHVPNRTGRVTSRGNYQRIEAVAPGAWSDETDIVVIKHQDIDPRILRRLSPRRKWVIKCQDTQSVNRHVGGSI